MRLTNGWREQIWLEFVKLKIPLRTASRGQFNDGKMRVNAFAFLLIISCAYSRIPRLLSYTAVPVHEATDDATIVPQSEEIKFYLFGDDFKSIVKVGFSYKNGVHGSSCEDEKYSQQLEIKKISNRSVELLFAGDSYYFTGAVYFCFKHKTSDGTTTWTHQPTLHPSSILFQSDILHFEGPSAWILYAGLLCCSALFSGLNLGIMTLDIMSLEILIKAGSEKEKKMAAVVLPVRRRGNLILCSLTMANVVVNVVISMLSDKLVGGTGAAIIYASCGILVFGEIIPQALCNRFSLFIAYKTIVFTKLAIYLTSPIAFPVSLLLDKLLGEDMGRTMNKATLAELIKKHVRREFSLPVLGIFGICAKRRS